jgi:hypothetical protein
MRFSDFWRRIFFEFDRMNPVSLVDVTRLHYVHPKKLLVTQNEIGSEERRDVIELVSDRT